jgi:hypothetical protein
MFDPFEEFFTIRMALGACVALAVFIAGHFFRHWLALSQVADGAAYFIQFLVAYLAGALFIRFVGQSN